MTSTDLHPTSTKKCKNPEKLGVPPTGDGITNKHFKKIALHFAPFMI